MLAPPNRELLTRPIHGHPDDCIKTLEFHKDDAGRADYFQSRDLRITRSHGDCAVVACALGAGVSYDQAFDWLSNVTLSFRRWNRRTFKEPWLQFILRWTTQNISELFPHTQLKHRSPLYGTHTDVYSFALSAFANFSLMFGEPSRATRCCLCSQGGIFVVDGILAKGEAHVTAIVDGAIRGDVDIRRDSFNVRHVWVQAGTPHQHFEK